MPILRVKMKTSRGRVGIPEHQDLGLKPLSCLWVGRGVPEVVGTAVWASCKRLLL